MLRRLRLAVGLLFLWPEVAGCGGSTIAESSNETGGGGGDPSCQAGSVRCSCYPNETCDGDLVCASGLCVALGTAGAGSTGAGGSSATGGGEALCSNVTPCSGELVGTWTVTSSCLTVSGDIDLGYVGLDHCQSASVAGSLDVTGTWTANADGTCSDDTHTTGSHHLELGEECKEFDATRIRCDSIGSATRVLGYADGSCADNLVTGGCTCEAVIDQPGPYSQTGGIGFAPNGGMHPADSYTTADNVLTIGEATYSYCVSGTRLRLTPVSDPWRSGTLVGSVELQMQ